MRIRPKLHEPRQSMGVIFCFLNFKLLLWNFGLAKLLLFVKCYLHTSLMGFLCFDDQTFETKMLLHLIHDCKLGRNHRWFHCFTDEDGMNWLKCSFGNFWVDNFYDARLISFVCLKVSFCHWISFLSSHCWNYCWGVALRARANKRAAFVLNMTKLRMLALKSRIQLYLGSLRRFWLLDSFLKWLVVLQGKDCWENPLFLFVEKMPKVESSSATQGGKTPFEIASRKHCSIRA